MTTGSGTRAQAKHRAERSDRRRLSLAIAAATVVVVSATSAIVAVSSSQAEENSTWAPVATDTFERTLDSGWGDADLGGAYALSAPSYFSLDGASGIAAPPRSGSSLTASLGAVSSADTLASTTFTIPTLPEKGNGIYAGLQARAFGSSYYLASARVATGGAVYVSILRVVGSTAKQVALVRDVRAVGASAAGDELHLEVSVTGESPVELLARAWVGSSTPPAWQASATDDSDARLADAGSLALWAYVSGSTPAQPVAFDEFEAFTLVPSIPSATPTASSVPTPPPTDLPEVRSDPGAGTVGDADYAVPSGAIFVSPEGLDNASGSESSPFADLADAILAAPSGATIVLRAGSYHGSFILPKHKRLTVQPYPGEEVWLDGSRIVEGWDKTANAWVKSGWDVRFDSSPTYSRGKPDGTAPGWQFVNPDYPMAAHPDQVWIDDTAQKQVASLKKLVAGSFYVDYDAEKLYLGSDPGGAVVRASDTVKAITISGNGDVVRGIGIRRFSPSVPDIGAVAISGEGVRLEKVTIIDSATTGLAIFSSNVSIVDVTISRSGMLGAQASTADGLVASGLLVTDNNTEHFNRAPVSGGFKIHKSRDVSVTGSAFLRNRGNGLWFDESVYDMTVVTNDIVDSVGNGLVIELSAKALVADNIIVRSEKDGILVSDSGHVEIWNNTLSGNDRSINIVQGLRRAADLTLPGHDSRQKLPDPTVTWTTEDITIGNNVLADGRGKCVLCVEDYSHERSAAQMAVRSNGNVLHRTSATQPSWVVVWSRGRGNPAVFTSVGAFTAATGQDSDSLALDARPALAGTSLAPAVVSVESAIARPLPPDVAAGARRQSGERHLGAWD
jgi:hypothetical protein